MKMCANLLCQLYLAHGSVLNIIAIANLLKLILFGQQLPRWNLKYCFCLSRQVYTFYIKTFFTWYSIQFNWMDITILCTDCLKTKKFTPLVLTYTLDKTKFSWTLELHLQRTVQYNSMGLYVLHIYYTFYSKLVCKNIQCPGKSKNFNYY